MRSQGFGLALFLSLTAVGCSSDPDESATGAGASSTSGSGGQGGGGPTGDLQGEVTRYDYRFDTALAKARAGALVAVAAPGGDCMTLSCDLPSLDAVDWNASPAREASLDGGLLRACGAPVTPASPLTLSAEGTVPEKTFFGLDVGFSRITDMDGGTFTYLLSWIGGCSRFGPCDPDPSKLVEVAVEVTHPSGSVALCPGVLTPGDTVTRCEVKGTLAPTYSAFALAEDPLWVRSPFITAAGVDLVFYEVPSGKLAASIDKASAKAFFEWLTGLLGPFPYGPELRFAGGPTKWLGFEHPANVILLEDMPDLVTSYADTTMHVFMHETVHQWAGDRTTLAETPDFVWKEATAEYLAYVFEDEQRPAGEASASLDYWDTVSLQSAHFPRPTDEPALAAQKFYGDVYGPGPMVLYIQLEALLGRPAVLGGIQAFLAEPGARSVVDLKQALEAASGKDLSAYFDAWVFGSGKPEWPTFRVSAEQAGTEVTVTVTQENASGKLYGCVVEVEVQGATTSARALVDFGTAPAGATATATVSLEEPLAGTLLDPDHKLVGREVQSGVASEAPAPLPVWIF